jgi:hypothetical protein
MVKGNIFLKDYDNVFDWCCRRGFARHTQHGGAGRDDRRRRKGRKNQYAPVPWNVFVSHGALLLIRLKLVDSRI